MLEKEIEQKLKKQVEHNIPGALCLKFVSPGNSGVPDRLILIPGGVAVFVELKAPGKKERKLQTFIQNKIREKGFLVFSSVNSDEKIHEVVKACEEVYHERI